MFRLSRQQAQAADREQGLGLVVTDVGYFPSAARHHVERAEGTDQLIVIYCVAGDGWAEVAGRRLTVRPGRVVVIGRGVPHAYGAGDDQPWTIHWIHVAGRSCRAVESLLVDQATSPLVEVGNDVVLSRLFERVFDLVCGSDVADGLARASLVVAGLFERLVELRRQSAPVDDSRDQMTRAIQLMWSRVNTDVSLAELAGVAGLSVSHFAATFRTQMGVSPVAYFHRLKMQQAAQLLETTALSIKAVAGRVGYVDPLYFSRRFRATHRVSPAQYRAARVRRVEE